MHAATAIGLALAVALAASGCASPGPEPVGAWVESADDAGDHWRMVEYYRSAADEARERAAEHRLRAGRYEARRAQGMPFAARAVEHCDTLAALEGERALRFDRLAALHEQLATQEIEP